MSMQRVMRSFALAAGFATFGCGTMANLDGRELPVQSPPGQALTTPFGGVRRDLIWAKTAESTTKLRYVADLPLSLIGDLVTLPKTVTGTHSDALLQDRDSNVADGLAGTPAKAAVSP
jgi:hypothetical protein